MKNKKIYQGVMRLILSVVLAFAAFAPASAQISVNINILPPYPSKYTDYISRPQQVLIIIRNSSNINQNVQLRGELTGDNGISIKGIPNYKSASPIRLGPNEVRQLNINDISSLFDINKVVFTGITKSKAISDNGLPEGNYQICLEAFDYYTNKPLSDAAPAGCSNIFPVSNVEDPTIILPYDGQTLSSDAGQNFIISWSTPAGSPPSTQYLVQMAEMFDNRSPELAILSSPVPIFFQQTVTGINNLLYSSVMPALTPGRRYALMVTAKDQFNTVTFRNGGHSKAITFVYSGPGNGAGSIVQVTGDTAKKTTKGKIPTIAIKGNVNWYFRKSEENPPPAAASANPQKDQGTSVMQNAALISMVVDPNSPATTITTDGNSPSGPRTNLNIRGNANFRTTFTGADITPTAPVVGFARERLRFKGVAVEGGGSGIAIVTNAGDSFNEPGLVSHPLANTDVKLMYAGNTGYTGGSNLIGSATTDAQGNFELKVMNPAADGYAGGEFVLSIGSNVFSIVNQPVVPITDTTTIINVGEVKMLAATYRLLPSVTDAANATVATATVSIYRKTDIYNTEPFLRYEGNLDPSGRKTRTIDGEQYTLIDSLQNGQAASRYFYSSGPSDTYKVMVGAEGYSPYSTTLAASASSSTDATQPFTLQQTYNLSSEPTVFSGHVYSELQGVQNAMKGAVVTLYLNNDTPPKGDKGTNVKDSPGSALISELQTPQTNAITTNYSSMVSRSPLSGFKGASLINSRLSLKSVQPAFLPPSNAGASKSGTSTYAVTSANQLVSDINNLITTTQLTAVTDDNGNFSIANVPVSTHDMHYTVAEPAGNRTVSDSVLINTKGKTVNVQVPFHMQGYAVTGRILDESGNPIPSPMVKWASGGTWVPSTADGYFTTYNTTGTDTLIIEKSGYGSRHLPVTITAPATQGNQGGNSMSNYDKYSAALQTTTQFKQAANSGKPLLAISFGIFNKQEFTSLVSPVNGSSPTKTGTLTSVSLYPQLAALAAAVLPSPDDDVSGAIDVGTVTLKTRISRLLVTVTDANKNPVSGALLSIDGTETIFPATDGNGQVNIQGSTSMVLDVKGPAGSDYAPLQYTNSSTDQDNIVPVTIQLNHGAVVTGRVTAANGAIAGANVSVDGYDFISTQSAADGSYTIVVPSGDYTLKAALTGYISANKEQIYTGHQVVNFQLGAAGFAAGKLLGFPVEIDNVITKANGNKVLSGSFINIPANSIFALKPGAKIRFSNVEVSIQNNIPVPVNEQIVTDEVSVKAMAFKYLPLILDNNNSPIIISKRNGTGTQGQLNGFLSIDYGSFVPSGIPSYISNQLKQYISETSQSTPASLVVLTEDGSVPPNTSLFLSAAGKQDFNLGGFDVVLDLPNSSVGADGLHLKGSVNFASVPLLGNTTFNVQDLWIGTNGAVKAVKINTDPPLSFNIANWGASLKSLTYNDNGFVFSGSVSMQLPSSSPSEVDFSNLQVAADGLYGGIFSIPATGIDVFGIVSFKAGATPLSFGKLGNTGVYYIGGSGLVHFPSMFDDIDIKFFQIQTDGKFAATIPANIHKNFDGLADVAITSLGFQDTNGVHVDVGGNFTLTAIPDFKASVGGIHFGTGGKVSIDQMGIGFDMPGIGNVGVTVGFSDQPDKTGFMGQGDFGIAGLGGAGVGFNYYKVKGGISVGAQFSVGVLIPLGDSGFFITKVGGGFQLEPNAWSVNIDGTISLGVGPLMNTDVNLQVNNGPVITGTAIMRFTGIQVGNGNMTIDIPHKLITIDYAEGVNLIPGLTNSSGANLVLSLDKTDRYFIVGSYTIINDFDVFKRSATVALGYNVNFGKHPELSNYSNSVDPDLLNNGLFNGISANMEMSLNVPFNPPSIDLGDGYKAGVSAHLSYDEYGFAGASFNPDKNNPSINMLVKFGSAFSAGASVDLALASVDVNVGFSAKMAGNIYLSPSQSYLNVSATGTAQIQAGVHIGSNDYCSLSNSCFTGFCSDWGWNGAGASAGICFNPTLTVGVDTRRPTPLYINSL